MMWMWGIGFLTGCGAATIGWCIDEIRMMKRHGKQLQEATEALRLASLCLERETWKV